MGCLQGDSTFGSLLTRALNPFIFVSPPTAHTHKHTHARTHTSKHFADERRDRDGRAEQGKGQIRKGKGSGRSEETECLQKS